MSAWADAFGPAWGNAWGGAGVVAPPATPSIATGGGSGGLGFFRIDQRDLEEAQRAIAEAEARIEREVLQEVPAKPMPAIPLPAADREEAQAIDEAHAHRAQLDAAQRDLDHAKRAAARLLERALKETAARRAEHEHEHEAQAHAARVHLEQQATRARMERESAFTALMTAVLADED